MELKIIKDDDVAKMIRMAKSRAVYAGPGVTDTVAGALIEVRKRIDRHRVRVILDGGANALRLGYGQADPMPMLLEHDVDVRIEQATAQRPPCAKAGVSCRVNGRWEGVTEGCGWSRCGCWRRICVGIVKVVRPSIGRPHSHRQVSVSFR